ncbi:MAG: DUF1161 domain-containing protein [Candidatus Electrothrix sp. AR3]|nr:DUF1161 domain-containing protein [Candidatus Electrothrix sp. AR3]
MKYLLAVLSLFFLSFGHAHAMKLCDDLKAEIAVKIEASGVKSYELTIVDKDQVDDVKKVVGSCEGGTKKILYVRK